MTRTMRQTKRAAKAAEKNTFLKSLRCKVVFCMNYRTHECRDTGSNIRREKRLLVWCISVSRCVLVPLLAVRMHYAWRLKELLTFAGGLTAWPSAVGEANPFCRAVERVTRGASEAHFSVLLKAALLSGGMGRRARIPAGAPFITCTDKCTYILDTILHTSSSFFQLSKHMYFSTWTETNCMFLLKKKKKLTVSCWKYVQPMGDWNCRLGQYVRHDIQLVCHYYNINSKQRGLVSH